MGSKTVARQQFAEGRRVFVVRFGVGVRLVDTFIFGLLYTAVPAQQTPAISQPTDYIIGPQDVLMITVYDQEDLNGKFPVDSDGTFTFPLIGRVKGGGLTLREL